MAAIQQGKHALNIEIKIRTALSKKWDSLFDLQVKKLQFTNIMPTRYTLHLTIKRVPNEDSI